MEISRIQAASLAASFLADQKYSRYGYTPAVDIDHIGCLGHGFVVPWNTEAFLRSRKADDGLAGNIPIFVDLTSGACRLMTDSEVEEYYSREK